MNFNTTNDSIFLVETAPPFDRVSLQFVPENMKLDRTANISKIGVVGRNNPLFQYTGGDDKLSFTIDFYTDQSNREDVVRKVDFLKSLAMNDGGFGAAKNVKIVMGKVFRDEVWIVDSVNATYNNFDDRYQWLPIRASVAIKLTLDPIFNRRIRDVRR